MEGGLIVVRFVLGLIFLRTGTAKLFALDKSRRVVRSYGLLPARAIGIVTLMLAATECAVALALMGGWGSRLAGSCTAMLLVLYAAAIAANVLRRNAIDCGCGGWGGPMTVSWPLVARNVVLAAIAVFVAVDAPPSIPTLLAEERMARLDVVALALCAVLILVVLAVVPRVTALLRTARSAAEVLPSARSS